MIVIQINKHVAGFAEDKDIARDIRTKEIMPAITAGDNVIVDFEGVRLSTQSFIHALLSDVIREFGEDVLDSISFKNCPNAIKGLIETVVQYTLDSLHNS